MDLSELRLDKSKKEDGVWLNLDEETSVRVRYMKSQEALRKHGELRAAYGKRGKRGNLTPSEEEAIAKEVVAQAVIVDWEGITDQGEEFPYSEDNARRLVEEYELFRDFVCDAAVDEENFREEEAYEEEIDELKKVIEWECRHGGQRMKTLLDVERARGKSIKTLDEMPDVPPPVAWVREAFWVLNSSRSVGFGVGFIPLTEIEAYVRLFEVERRVWFVTVIRELDEIYMDRQRAKDQNAREKAKNHGGTGKAQHHGRFVKGAGGR